jgi:adenosylcobinamide amidohydrolase
MAQLAHFLVVCAQAKVPFKATAGLHHPVRSVNKLTYEPDSASATMHGFINVFVAATMAYYGAREADVLTVLEEEDPAAFAWSKTSLKWRNQRLSMKQVKEARSDFAISFGSCSFVEPIADLQKLGWL